MVTILLVLPEVMLSRRPGRLSWRADEGWLPTGPVPWLVVHAVEQHEGAYYDRDRDACEDDGLASAIFITKR